MGAAPPSASPGDVNRRVCAHLVRLRSGVHHVASIYVNALAPFSLFAYRTIWQRVSFSEKATILKAEADLKIVAFTVKDAGCLPKMITKARQGKRHHRDVVCRRCSSHDVHILCGGCSLGCSFLSLTCTHIDDTHTALHTWRCSLLLLGWLLISHGCILSFLHGCDVGLNGGFLEDCERHVLAHHSHL